MNRTRIRRRSAAILASATANLQQSLTQSGADALILCVPPPGGIQLPRRHPPDGYRVRLPAYPQPCPIARVGRCDVEPGMGQRLAHVIEQALQSSLVSHAPNLHSASPAFRALATRPVR